jgi:predicted MFS family arabinose efflux permease
MFAGQSALIATAPVLPRLARDLHVSTAAAGQLRTVAGLAAGVTALLLWRMAGRAGLARQLRAAAALLALASLASAAAPGFPALALAQLPVGVAVAVLTSAGTLAAAEWTSPERRTRSLSWALIGQPSAWLVGMPLIGLVGERSWRLGWLALPLIAAVAAAAALAPRAGEPPPPRRRARLGDVLAAPVMGRWLASELLVNSAWAGTLVFAGALLSESYGTSSRRTGCLLSAAAAAYVAGNLAGRRAVGGEPRRALPALTAGLAVAVGLFGVVRPGLAASTGLLALASFVAGGRTLVSSAFGLNAPPQLRPAIAGLRAATMQLGYFLGSLVGGTALAAGGWSAFGGTMSCLFLAAAATVVFAFAPAAGTDGLTVGDATAA